jgi:hypothetical protein
VVLLEEPMRAAALGVLADEEKKASEMFLLLSAVLVADEAAPVRLFHPSFPNFIMDSDRCQDGRFVVVAEEGHAKLAARCLDIMNSSLRRDICDIGNPSLLDSEIHDLELRLAQAAPDELRYATKYWHVHLNLGWPTSSSTMPSLKVFGGLLPSGHLLRETPQWARAFLSRIRQLEAYDSQVGPPRAPDIVRVGSAPHD